MVLLFNKIMMTKWIIPITLQLNKNIFFKF